MTFPSVHEMFDPLTTIRKQHTWSWFSGSSSGSISGGTTTGILDDWSITNNVGSNSYGVNDEVDGGFKITTGTASNCVLTLNNGNNATHKWTDPTNCVWIAVIKQFQTTNQKCDFGLRGTTSTGATNNANHFKQHTSWSPSDEWFYETSQNNTAKEISTGVTVDTAWHTFKGEQSSSSCSGSIDGVLKVTMDDTNASGKRPNDRQQFTMQMQNLSGVSRSLAIRYVEVYNT